MPKKADSKTITLSGFFKTNLNIIKSFNVAEDLETSPYFQKLALEKADIEETKKKKVKRKSFGPQCKGFSLDDQNISAFKKNQIEEAVNKCEDRLRGEEGFLGFTFEEVDKARMFSCKSDHWVRRFEKRKKRFKGFSEEDQNISISQATEIVGACTSIRTEIYKNIDRRVLTNHLQETSQCGKVVCSKYWWQESKIALKEEEKNWGKDGFVDSKCFVKVNEIKTEDDKTDIDRLDRENVILSEILKLSDELKEIRRKKYEASEAVKLQNSCFIQIKKELIITQFVPPKSPHNLIEEQLYYDPWALLVATIFLNKTAARSARPYVFWFLEENPDPLSVVAKKVEQLEMYFGALGLQKTRSMQVWRMSHDFLYKEWKKVRELHGIGQYAEDAFRMFCLGDFSVEPKDRYLRIYKAWYKMYETNLRLKEMNS